MNANELACEADDRHRPVPTMTTVTTVTIPTTLTM
jgi:hypothetical protein